MPASVRILIEKLVSIQPRKYSVEILNCGMDRFNPPPQYNDVFVCVCVGEPQGVAFGEKR